MRMKKEIQNLSTKKTFNTLTQMGVTEKIGLFSRMSQDVKCVSGSGYCAGPAVNLPVQKPGDVSTVLSIQPEMGKTDEKKRKISKKM